MEDYRRKFQDLLRELFQFESADLDFGIYRIMNCKREAIEKFIEKDLLDAVSEELHTGELQRQENAVKELAEITKKIQEAFGGAAINGDGNLNPNFHNTPLGARYLELKELTSGARSFLILETTVFNHLYFFFSRYYDSGDFMSKRRYSKREKYAIPYNGEEVYLHWANKDQYYIKTGEHFQDYSFKSKSLTIHFKLKNADVEQDNIKGDKRFFLPVVEEADYKKETGEIIIPFEYRPLTEQESITYGARNQQDSIIAEAVKNLPEHFKGQVEALAALMTEKHISANGEVISYLEHHLCRYTRRNTSDFFIHKDLQGFLERELDFYLKNEVLSLDELETVGEIRAEGWFQTMRAIKNIGRKIIAFLAQIENFQKRLFEKKKFITETNYCLTLDRIPEEFYPEIAANEAQRQEWVKLFAIDEINDTARGKYSQSLTVEFLKNNPHLVLDTKHFSENFKDRLLASIDNLDEKTDGLLIHSENFQALNLLQERYREKVKCVYIDPPYNTGSDEFVYKDNYMHSSWLCMIIKVMLRAKYILSNSATSWINLDDNEVHRFILLADSIFGSNSFIGNIAWKKTTGDNKTIFAFTHDNIIIYSKQPGIEPNRAPLSIEQRKYYSNPDNDPRGDWAEGDYRSKWTRNERPNLYYPIIHPMTKEEIYPDTYSDSPRVWGCSPETHKENEVNKLVWWGIDGQSKEPKKKRFLMEHIGTNIRSFWENCGSNDEATQLLRAIFGREKVYPTPKPTKLIQKILTYAMIENNCVIDYFAGSGTTAHAVLNLNREDGGSRKYILVEMGDYFDTVMLPRIKKVVYSVDWKEGKPVSRQGSSHIIKYLRLESYEDTLNNITFDESSGEPMLKFEDYLLRYMLDWETKGSETFLDVRKLEKPFSYKLNLREGDETRVKPVDLPETFNYLIGLEVGTRKVYFNGERKYLAYRGKVDHKSAAVIWREIEGWSEDDFKREKQFIMKQRMTGGAEIIYINGDSFLAGAKSLDPVFKRKMFEGVN